MEPGSIQAIFLAAGSSVRMGKKNKLLLNLGETTMVQHCFEQLSNSIIDKIVVVTGFEADEIANRLTKGKAKFVHNPYFKNGMTSSIQEGINAIKNTNTALLIALSDMPFLTTNDYNLLINTFKSKYKNAPLIVQPQIDNKFGNPVLFSHHFTSKILEHPHPNGCKEIIKQNAEKRSTVSLKNMLAFKDIDTPEEYSQLKKYYKL